jgi:hypothetical protein
MQTNNTLFKAREKTKKKTKRVRCEILIIDFNSYDSNNTIIKGLNLWLSLFWHMCGFAGAVSSMIFIAINLEAKLIIID